ncbi:hypothetical protein [Streptomyces echinatus]|uniref:hypothetical protein n=1 Tax=Streptomyces echinatus TaxID=67293 RepID=UPI003793212E
MSSRHRYLRKVAAQRHQNAHPAPSRFGVNQMTELTARIKAVDGPPTDRWV